jgi:hypothetical protein
MLLHNALAKVLPEHWKNNITYVQKNENEMTVGTTEFTINVLSDSSSTEWSDYDKEH